MKNNYKNVVEEFNKRSCQLLVTEDQYNIIKTTTKNFKLDYKASCGHNHKVFYNVFKSRNTGILCPNCKGKEIGKKIKEKINNNQLSKISRIEQEFTFIKNFQDLIKDEFYIVKAFDGCYVDIIYKPHHIQDDKWVGIQVKTTDKIRLTYSFHINNFYKNCLIFLYCVEDENIWFIPENVIGYQKKISIGIHKSKYDIYRINKELIVNKLNELYTTTTKFNFNVLNTPTNIYQQREQIFRTYRLEKIKFLNFIYEEMEASVYDFMIEKFKIQEKVSSVNKLNKSCVFQLCKNNGKINTNRIQIQYDIGDNDFYWLNFSDKRNFFVIPEHILIDKGFIGNKIENNNKHNLKITIKDKLHTKSLWLQPYMFDYESINDDQNKNRLINLFTINK